VSAGGTREPLDPVRFIGNRSSGEMGVSLARAAQARGASVFLVAANLEVPPPAGVSVIDAPTAHQMREAMVAHRDHADVVIMAAAVADWVAADVSAQKLRKSDLGESYSPHLVRAPDILAELGASKPARQILVGFAAESAENAKDREKSAKNKLKSKKLDAIVLNEVGDQLGFGPVQTTVTLFFSASPQSLSVEGSKHSIAGTLLDALLDR
jgi:phosphopantothenoylcysteine decarboxylase/phosphopantothenate--cysteine ligase